ncbi:hypothetical protein BDZ91DRAFT_423599 [Kalaharituber pfeilii]|nr:hypothetical protein BDZ91DRAFT_423599 [Kalaharituber pfeilii]
MLFFLINLFYLNHHGNDVLIPTSFPSSVSLSPVEQQEEGIRQGQPGQRVGHEHLRLRESGPIRALQLVTPPHSLHTLGCLIFCRAAVRCGPQSSAPIAFPSTYSISRVLQSR